MSIQLKEILIVIYRVHRCIYTQWKKPVANRFTEPSFFTACMHSIGGFLPYSTTHRSDPLYRVVRYRVLENHAAATWNRASRVRRQEKICKIATSSSRGCVPCRSQDKQPARQEIVASSRGAGYVCFSTLRSWLNKQKL